MNLDRITLEVWWSRLVAIADEAATTLLRTAFSTIIRESNDYTVVLMNTSGQTIAECHRRHSGLRRADERAAHLHLATGRDLVDETASCRRRASPRRDRPPADAVRSPTPLGRCQRAVYARACASPGPTCA